MYRYNRLLKLINKCLCTIIIEKSTFDSVGFAAWDVMSTTISKVKATFVWLWQELV